MVWHVVLRHALLVQPLAAHVHTRQSLYIFSPLQPSHRWSHGGIAHAYEAILFYS
jgi:hypothetical protein